MTVKEFNQDVLPLYNHAKSFINNVYNAISKSGAEAEKQFAIIGWNDEVRTTIKCALNYAEENARKHIDVHKVTNNTITNKDNTEEFTHVCKSDREEFPGCFAIFARVIEETADWVTIDRFQKWGAVPCGIVTISRKDFDKYYTRLT